MFAFAACGELNSATQDPGSSIPGTPGTPGTPSDPSQGTEFTVTILDENGEVYLYTRDMTAQWRNLSTGSVYEASFDSDHTASISGLDGEYMVTVTGLEDMYTYDSNSSDHVANTNSPDVTIQLVLLSSYSTANRNGTLWSEYIINNEGVYRTSVESATQEVFFLYRPVESGIFSISSWVNATEDEINPQAKLYIGTDQYAGTYTLISGGGDENTYTKNFKFEIRLSDEMIGSYFRFCISAQSRFGEYPVTVDFKVEFIDDYELDLLSPEILEPQEEFKQAQDENGTLTFVTRYVNGSNMLDERLVGLNKDDGYYHLLDDDGQPTGAILYAYIGTGSPLYGTPIVNVEDSGNSALKLYTSDGLERYDYKLLLSGYDLCIEKWLGQVRSNMQDFTSTDEELIAKYGTPTNGAYVGYEDVEGYYDYCNEEGMYPVTAELQYFFQRFAEVNHLFNDNITESGGQSGWSEQYAKERGITCNEDSMWLVFCAYYLV